MSAAVTRRIALRRSLAAPAFAQRRAIFGPHDLRDDRIRASSYLADDLSMEARRALRSGELG